MCYSLIMNSMSERKKLILMAVVREYVRIAKPVSSKHLKKSEAFDFSSATLRNVMAELENEGYLTHPHTSAGRIPTSVGYRYYVDTISNNLSLGLTQRRYIMDFFSKQGQLEEILKRTCNFITKITPYLGIVTKYSYRQIGIKHIDLVPLKNNQLLIVVITKTGEIIRDRLEISNYDSDIQELEQILNEQLSGMDTALLIQKCKHIKALRLFGSLFDEISTKLVQLLEQQQTILFYDGITNLLSFPEFSRINHFYQIYNFLEEEAAVKQMETYLANDSTYIAIGNELKNEKLSDASLVLVPYHYNDQSVGTVGIMGPMRMDYEKAIATTECVAGNLSLALQKMS